MNQNDSSGGKKYDNDIGHRVRRELGSAYGKSTFLKVKADMFNCGILNIDFVDRDEKDDKRKSIGTYLKMAEANNLFSMVLSDEFFKRLIMSCCEALNAGKPYPDVEFSFQGGSKGMCWILEIFAGSKMMNVVKNAGAPYKLTGELLLKCKAGGNVMFRSKKGEGQTTATGGVSMKSGANQKNIQVPVGCDNLSAIAREVTSDWQIYKETAYRMGCFAPDGDQQRHDDSYGNGSGGNFDDEAVPDDVPPPPAAMPNAASGSLDPERQEYLEAANKNSDELINLFRDGYSFLSNMSRAKVTYNGLEFMSSEAAFQSAKCAREEDRQTLSKTLKGKDARSYGSSVEMVPDWEQIKDEVMVRVVYAKFTQNPLLMEKLLDTGNAKLVEGNFWHDNYWGKCACKKCTDKASPNVLGRSLFFVRNCINRRLDFEKYLPDFLADLHKEPGARKSA